MLQLFSFSNWICQNTWLYKMEIQTGQLFFSSELLFSKTLKTTLHLLMPTGLNHRLEEEHILKYFTKKG